VRQDFRAEQVELGAQGFDGLSLPDRLAFDSGFEDSKSSLLIGWASTLVGLPVLGSALWLGINRPVPIVSMRAISGVVRSVAVSSALTR
jgi:hypothetical protein